VRAVIDANIAVYAVLPGTFHDAAWRLLERLVREEVELCSRAYRWAERLGQMAVYDAIYVALAERLDALFYTADRALATRCWQVGAHFVQVPEGFAQRGML